MNCNVTMTEKRLNAVPWAPYCLDCQELSEKRCFRTDPQNAFVPLLSPPVGSLTGLSCLRILTTPMPRPAVVVALVLLLPGNAFAGRSLRTGNESQAVTISALVLDPTNPQILYAGKSSGLFQSRDGGASWSFVSGFAPGFLAVAPSSVGVNAAGGPTVSRFDDGGQHWSLLKDFGGAFVTVTSTVPAVDPTDADRVFVGVNDIITNGSGTVWRSIDGGASWEPVLGPLPFVGILAIDPREPHGTFAGADGLARSLDGGSTWTAGSLSRGFAFP
jgi:hypothetical protein